MVRRSIVMTHLSMGWLINIWRIGINNRNVQITAFAVTAHFLVMSELTSTHWPPARII